MNERFRELAEEVGFDLYSEDKERMFQEFAELIVKECAHRLEILYGYDKVSGYGVS